MDTKTIQRNTGLTAQTPATIASRAESAEKSRSTMAGGQAAADGLAAPSVSVDLSDRARDAVEARKKAFEIAKATPDIREDRVAELKRRIQEGSYQVDSEKVADGMIRETLFDYLSQTSEDLES